MRFACKILALKPQSGRTRDIGLACESNIEIDLSDLDIQMELFYRSSQRMQLSPILINTLFSNMFFHIIFSLYVWLQNEVLNCKFPNKC